MSRAAAASELGVSASASEDEIRAAYKSKAMQWHPDKNRGKPTEKEATENFQKISAAYKIITEGGDGGDGGDGGAGLAPRRSQPRAWRWSAENDGRQGAPAWSA